MLCLLGCLGAATIKHSLRVKFHPQLVTNLVIVVALLSAVQGQHLLATCLEF
mgnify:CR=1 FL=1